MRKNHLISKHKLWREREMRAFSRFNYGSLGRKSLQKEYIYIYIAKMPNTSDTTYTRIYRAKVSKIQSRKHEVKNPVVGNCDHGYVAELFGNRDRPPVALQFFNLSRWEAVPLRSTAPRPVQNARWPTPWLPASPSSMEPRLQPDNQMSRRAP